MRKSTALVLAAALALAACDPAVDRELAQDHANYAAAHDKLWADEQAGNTAAIPADTADAKLALEQLRYDSLDWPDPNGGHGASGGGGHNRPN